MFSSLAEMSGHNMVCFDKTFEAAEALLHMESPGGLHNERSTGKPADGKHLICCLLSSIVHLSLMIQQSLNILLLVLFIHLIKSNTQQLNNNNI